MHSPRLRIVPVLFFAAAGAAAYGAIKANGASSTPGSQHPNSRNQQPGTAYAMASASPSTQPASNGSCECQFYRTGSDPKEYYPSVNSGNCPGPQSGYGDLQCSAIKESQWVNGVLKWYRVSNCFRMPEDVGPDTYPIGGRKRVEYPPNEPTTPDTCEYIPPPSPSPSPSPSLSPTSLPSASPSR